MKFKCLSGTIIVKPKEQERTTTSGIIIHGAAENVRVLRGEVIACAEYMYLYDKDSKTPIGKIPIEVKVGDQVIFEESFARDYQIEGEKYFFCKSKDIYVILEKDLISQKESGEK